MSSRAFDLSRAEEALAALEQCTDEERAYVLSLSSLQINSRMKRKDGTVRLMITIDDPLKARKEAERARQASLARRRGGRKPSAEHGELGEDYRRAGVA